MREFIKEHGAKIAWLCFAGFALYMHENGVMIFAIIMAALEV